MSGDRAREESSAHALDSLETLGIFIPAEELRLEFIRSSGPGGQNVNKVATAVRLSYDVRRSRSIPDDFKERLLRLAGSRMTEAGVLQIVARRFRTQGANRKDAFARLAALLRRAAMRPRPRRATRPTAASRARRLEEKRRAAPTTRPRRARHGDSDGA
ncbi:MAG: alternative ribosome rescue aminoacyl-tRNA hydrolase ArfB [bacterium]